MTLEDSFTLAHAEHRHRGRDDLSVALLDPIAALPGWAARLDWKRRRRDIPGHDVNTAAYTVRQDAERKSTEWNFGR
jgi:hypothetical protein